MDIPENTVKTYLHRGKEQLRIELKGAEYDERETLAGNIRANRSAKRGSPRLHS